MSLNKSLLILKPTTGNPPSKIINPDTFKILQKFEKCFKFKAELFEYESIHDAIPVLAKKNEWMPLLGAPTAKALEMMVENKPFPRWKNAKEGRSYLTIVEPDDRFFVLEIDKEYMVGFDPLKPEHGLKKYLSKNNITCDITWQLSSSQKPDSEIMCVHLFGEFDQDYSLGERKFFALSLDTDGSVYNGTNPIYVAPPQFRTSLEGEELPDPIPNRIGFIEGESQTLSMPDIKDIDIKLKKHGRKIVKKKGGFREISYVRKNVAEGDIKSGKNYHDAMLFLSSQMANHKKTAKEIKNELTILMNKVKSKDDRWFERMDDEHLDSICETAIEFVKANPAKSQNKPTAYGSMKSKSDTETIELEWDIYGYIPKNRVTLLAGDKGDGKSTFCAWVASQYTINDSKWKQADNVFPKRNVAWLSAEEEHDAEILSRFIINDGDKNMFYELDHRIQVGDSVDFWDVKRDQDEIVERLVNADIGLLLVDTAFSFCGDANVNSTVEMRRVLLAYGDIASRAKCTIIALAHLNIGASGSIVDDITGSGQIVAAVRSCLGLVRDKATDKVYVSAVKNNFCNIKKLTTVFNYQYKTLNTGSRNAWGIVTEINEVAEITADDVRIMNKRSQALKLSSKPPEASNDDLVIFMAKAIKDEEDISYEELASKTRVLCGNAGFKTPGNNKINDAKMTLKNNKIIIYEQNGRKHFWNPCGDIDDFIKAKEALKGKLLLS